MYNLRFFYVETTSKDGKCIESEHIAYLEFANALLKVIGIFEMAESQNSHHVIRIFQPQTEIDGP